MLCQSISFTFKEFRASVSHCFGMHTLKPFCEHVVFRACVLQGVEYSQSMRTGWKLPAKIRKLSEAERQAIRDKFHIIVEGSNLVAPVTRFEDLKLPRCVLDTLKSKGINRPTPIQMQVCCYSHFL